MKKMRLAVLAGALFLPSLAFAGSLSNPALSVPTGKGTIGLEYFYETSVFKPDDSVNFSRIRLHQSQVYAKGAYSGFDGNEIYLKLGAADAKVKKAFSDGSDFDKSFNFSGVAGVKQSFEVAPQVRVGGLVQYTLFSKYEQTKNIGGGQEFVNITNPYQVDVALAATYVGDGWAPYIGPVFSWQRFKYSDESGLSTTYKETNVAGGFVGLDLFSGPVRGNVEVQLSSQMSAGASISYLFP